MKDLFPNSQPRSNQNPKQKIIAIYDYHNADGKLLFQKIRYEPRDFKQRQPDGAGGWLYNLKGIEPVLYRLPELIEGVKSGRRIFVAEGEKDVETLRTQGEVATCNTHGAGKGKWRASYNVHLAGADVIILADNDETGREFAHEIAQSLHGVAKRVRLVDLGCEMQSLPEHGDITDIFEAAAVDGNSGADIMEALDAIIESTPPYELQSKMDAMREANKSPPLIVRAADILYEPPRWTIKPYIQRGKGTLFQGDNGTGKTACACGFAAHISTGNPLMGIPVDAPGDVLILSVEDDLPILRGRIEASGGDLTKCHFITNAAGLTFNDPSVEAAVKETKARLLIFDPLQAFLGAKVNMDKSNQTRPEFAKLFEMAARNDCAVIIISHIGKGSSFNSAVNRSLGSVDIPAAMRSILHIARNPENENECVVVHAKCSNAPKGESFTYTIGERGGVRWGEFNSMTMDDLSVSQKRKDRGVPYENEPLVQVFNQLIADRPGGGFWSYAEVKERGMQVLGFPPFSDTRDLTTKLDSSLARELQAQDGLIVTHGQRRSHCRGIRIERYSHPTSYQIPMASES